jgi:hypothetical protein
MSWPARQYRERSGVAPGAPAWIGWGFPATVKSIYIYQIVIPEDESIDPDRVDRGFGKRDDQTGTRGPVGIGRSRLEVVGSC